jgi:hypothetical protein
MLMHASRLRSQIGRMFLTHGALKQDNLRDLLRRNRFPLLLAGSMHSPYRIDTAAYCKVESMSVYCFLSCLKTVTTTFFKVSMRGPCSIKS